MRNAEPVLAIIHDRGTERPLWERRMAARRRKTLAVCHRCHTGIHHGRPVRHQVKE